MANNLSAISRESGNMTFNARGACLIIEDRKKHHQKRQKTIFQLPRVSLSGLEGIVEGLVNIGALLLPMNKDTRSHLTQKFTELQTKISNPVHHCLHGYRVRVRGITKFIIQSAATRARPRPATSRRRGINMKAVLQLCPDILTQNVLLPAVKT